MLQSNRNLLPITHRGNYAFTQWDLPLGTPVIGRTMRMITKFTLMDGTVRTYRVRVVLADFHWVEYDLIENLAAEEAYILYVTSSEELRPLRVMSLFNTPQEVFTHMTGVTPHRFLSTMYRTVGGR